jgi:hypothetical protein
MNVNITGIYNNTVVVDTNLFEDERLLQTGLSSLNETLFNIVGGLPFQYADLTSLTFLSDDYEKYKINHNLSIENINTDISNNYVKITTLTTLTEAIDEQFITTATEQHDYTDQETEAIRNEGYLQEAERKY